MEALNAFSPNDAIIVGIVAEGKTLDLFQISSWNIPTSMVGGILHKLKVRGVLEELVSSQRA